MELLDIYDENNNYLGYSLDRKEAHDKNLWHYHVSAWIMNYDGEILLQQRSFSKKKNPGKWTKTGGHVSADETCTQAIKREIFEEIGLEVRDVKYLSIEQIEELRKQDNKEYTFCNWDLDGFNEQISILKKYRNSR